MKSSALIIAVTASFTPGLGVAAERVIELSVHHVGEYAAVPWQKPGKTISPGSREDRVRDLNLSVASVNLRDDLPAEFFQRWRDAPQPGKVFLPRLYFWDGEDRYQGPMRDIEVYWRRLDRFLGAMNLADFQGIVLAEENISYGGRPEILSELYRRIKAKYHVPVWQWWSPSSSLPESGGWIPADGWIVDPYFMPKREFRRYVRKYLLTGLPLVIMPWASASEGSPSLTSEQWKANNDQLEVAVEFNLPVAFYWTYGRDSAGTSCMFGGGRGEIKSEWDRINHSVWDHLQRVQKLPADYVGWPSADEGIGDVLEIGPSRKGELIYTDDFTMAKCVDDASITGFRDLILDGKNLSSRGFRGRRVDASLVYHFAGDFAAQHPRAALTVLAGPASDRRVELALSADGQTWSHQATSRGADRQTLVASAGGDRQFASVRAFWVRIRLLGSPGSREQPTVSIGKLEIKTDVPPPKNSTVVLKPVPGVPNRGFYEDDFRTEKYRFTTKQTRDDRLEWSPGQIAVRLRPGGSRPELVWHVKTATPVRNVTVEITGRANTGSLGTNHFLDVSTDGKTWLYEQSTVGRPQNINGWAAHGLRIELAEAAAFRNVTEFFVRPRMKADGYKAVHPSLSGIVEKIRIEAVENH